MEMNMSSLVLEQAKEGYARIFSNSIKDGIDAFIVR